MNLRIRCSRATSLDALKDQSSDAKQSTDLAMDYANLKQFFPSSLALYRAPSATFIKLSGVSA